MSLGYEFTHLFEEDFGPVVSRSIHEETKAEIHFFPIPDFADRIMRLNAQPVIAIPVIRHIAAIMYESGIDAVVFPDWEKKTAKQDRYNDWAGDLRAITCDFLDIIYEKEKNMDYPTRFRWLRKCLERPFIAKMDAVIKNKKSSFQFSFIFPDGTKVKTMEKPFYGTYADVLMSVSKLIPYAGCWEILRDPFFPDDITILRDMIIHSPSCPVHS